MIKNHYRLAKMAQDPGDDVLLLDATVRRLDDDFDRPPAAAPRQR